MRLKFNRTDYVRLVKKSASRSPVCKNMVAAFSVGGLICAFGQGLWHFYRFCGLTADVAMQTVSITLIFLAAVLTAVGVFDRIARFAGAGTLVPITGFANAVVSPAIDNKSEGLILGEGAKIFTVAGPVLLYGILSGALYGVIYSIVLLF